MQRKTQKCFKNFLKFPYCSLLTPLIDFGNGGHLVWSNNNGYAVTSGSLVKIFDSNFSQVQELDLDFPVEGLYGGRLIGINGGDFVLFYTWSGSIVQKIDITPRDVIWNPKKDLLAITGKESFFLLRYDEKVNFEKIER